MRAKVGPARFAPEVLHEDGGVELAQQRDGQHEQRKRHELRDGDDDVDAGRFLHAARHEPHEQPQKRRRAHARQQVVAAFERMEEVPQRREQQDGERHARQARRHPVAPCGVEPDEVAESGCRVGVDAAGEIGAGLRQPVEAHHEREHAHEADGPADEHGAGAGASGGHVAGQREDASADAGRDHHHGEAEQIEAVRVDDLTFVAGGSCAGGEAPVEGFRGSVRHSPSFIWGSKGMLTQGTARCERRKCNGAPGKCRSAPYAAM